MAKTLHLVLLVALFALGATACEKKKTAAQMHAEKQAAWQADKRQRAIKYYQDLAQKYPDSPYAAQAKERLAAMGANTQGKLAPAGKP
jgi:outer membrane protein assembly factor BamD (BamD/ComL family)